MHRCAADAPARFLAQVLTGKPNSTEFLCLDILSWVVVIYAWAAHVQTTTPCAPASVCDVCHCNPTGVSHADPSVRVPGVVAQCAVQWRGRSTPAG